MALELEDVLAIQDLLHRYSHNADYNAPERMREVFTADASFEVPAMGLRFEGVEDIIAFFTTSREANARARHVISNAVIEGAGDSATSCAYLQVLEVQETTVATVALGRYFDELVRTPAGWRLRSRRVVLS